MDSPRNVRSQVQKMVLVIGATVGFIAALITIIAGLPTLHQVFFPSLSPPPTPAPVVSAKIYGPPCQAAQTLNQNWRANNGANATCVANGGVTISVTDPHYVASLYMIPSPGTTFEANHIIQIQISNLGRESCGGVISRGSRKDSSGYGFYICSDSTWYIIKYLPSVGAPDVLLSGTDPTITPQGRNDLTITVFHHDLQMIINRLDLVKVIDALYPTTEEISLNVGGKDAILSPTISVYSASAEFSNFQFISVENTSAP
jgi:hypothetical protein